MIPKKSSASFTTEILRFAKKGEKTGWTYVEIPSLIASKLFPENKKSFRVKGFLDEHPIKGVALLPMGEGNFIMPLNASLRKAIKKRSGDKLSLRLQVDHREPTINKDLMECLENDKEALTYFRKLTKSHQNYFSKWVDSAKTTQTKANRIARILNACSRKMNYSEMLRAGI